MSVLGTPHSGIDGFQQDRKAADVSLEISPQKESAHRPDAPIDRIA